MGKELWKKVTENEVPFKWLGRVSSKKVEIGTSGEESDITKNLRIWETRKFLGPL